MKRRQAHTLTNREINDINNNGLVDKYHDFDNSDFDNIFQPIDKTDYEIHASDNSQINNCKEEKMKGSRKASYIDELSSGYDATVQNDYDAGKGQTGQIGKGHEEEVAPKNNWQSDKRDAIGRAAATASSLRRTAANLTKSAVNLNKMADDMEKEDEDYSEEIGAPEGDVSDDDLGLDSDLEEEELADDDEGLIQQATAELLKKEATHPSEHNEKKDDPDANMDSQTGDKEWIDIGPGTFKDKRDEVGKADK